MLKAAAVVGGGKEIVPGETFRSGFIRNMAADRCSC